MSGPTKAELEQEIADQKLINDKLARLEKTHTDYINKLSQEVDKGRNFAQLLLAKLKQADGKTLAMRVYYGDLQPADYEPLRQRNEQNIDALFNAFNPQNEEGTAQPN